MAQRRLHLAGIHMRLYYPVTMRTFKRLRRLRELYILPIMTLLLLVSAIYKTAYRCRLHAQVVPNAVVRTNGETSNQMETRCVISEVDHSVLHDSTGMGCATEICLARIR